MSIFNLCIVFTEKSGFTLWVYLYYSELSYCMLALQTAQTERSYKYIRMSGIRDIRNLSLREA